MSLPLAEPGWTVTTTTAELDSHRHPVKSRGGTRGPYVGHASYVAAVEGQRGQYAGWTVNLGLAAWPLITGEELVAPDGSRYRVRTAVRRPGAPGSDLGHVHAEVELVSTTAAAAVP